MSIGNVNFSSHQNAVSTVSGDSQAPSAEQTAKIKQLLHVSMLEAEMLPALTKLGKSTGVKIGPPEEDFWLGTSPQTSSNSWGEPTTPFNRLASTSRQLDQLIAQLARDDEDPFPGPTSARDMKLDSEFSEGLDSFWSGMMDTFEERSGIDAVKHNYERDMSFLLSKGKQLNEKLSGMNSWMAAPRAEQLHGFLSGEKARIEAEYKQGMAQLEGGQPSAQQAADLVRVTALTSRTQALF